MPVCAQFKQEYRQNLVQDFYQNFDVLSGDTFFIGVGKPTSWLTVTGGNSDDFPPENIDSIKSDTDFWSTAYAFKKIQKQDVSIVVKRYDWAPNSVYDAYRDNVDLYNEFNFSKFYVLVDESRVYKCIDNNYGGLSTIAPTHTDSQIRTLSDGYRWKFLYTIPESQKKFLTKSQGTNTGYMPVQYVTRINENDDRESQYDVQNDAVDGSIDFIDIDENLRNYVVSDRVLFFNSANQVAGSTGAGATSVRIGGTRLTYENDYYNNMTIRFESGSGSGQQRRIVDYFPNGDSTATVILGSPLNFGISGGSNPTTYSIIPTVIVEGDGQANNSNLNTYATAAEVTVSFLGASSQRYLDRLELINNGKNYTYGSIRVVAGLTFTTGISGDMNLLARPIMSPPGGNGSNAVEELGANAIMIATNFDGNESNKISTENDYRQFCLIQNPLLKNKQVKLNLVTPGVAASFAVGATVGQGFTGSAGTGYNRSIGTVISWSAGTLGTTGTSELVLGNITGGTFSVGGWINGLSAQQIFRLREKTVAGTEYRLLRRLKLIPRGSTPFSTVTDDFTQNFIAYTLGNTADYISPSLANGIVYKWQLENATSNVGNLYLEEPAGNFIVNDFITQMNYFNVGVTGAKAKIIEVDEYEETTQTVYDQTIRLSVFWDGIKSFDSGSFVKDTTASNSSAQGYVMDWIPATGGTAGTLRLLPIRGEFAANQNLIYTNSGMTGSIIDSVLSSPELKYRSGTILHTQNLRPIERLPEQKEEIKLIVEF